MPEWLWSIIVGVGLLGLIAYAWRAHADHDDERNSALWNQIGRDSLSGMRGVLHRTNNIADGSVKEIDELRRRIDQLERRVFNGNGVPR
jgi:hypothetical protein